MGAGRVKTLGRRSMGFGMTLIYSDALLHDRHMKPVALGPFLGMNNRLPAEKLHVPREGDFVRSAVNVDLTAAGTFQRRRGATLALSGSDCHSFWSNGAVGYYVDHGTLYSLTGTAESPVKTAVISGLPMAASGMSYAECAGTIHCSNGLSLWRLFGAVATEASVPNPERQPTIAISNTGSLYRGTYLIAVTYVDGEGRESGATPVQTAEVPEHGRIALTDLPQRNGCLTSVYVSTTNGDDLYRVALTADSSLDVSVPHLGGGVMCWTQGLAPMPSGSILRAFKGRLLAAAGNTLRYSEPFAPGLCNPVRGYIVFPETITLVEPVQNGIYISADETYWLAGDDIEQAAMLPVLPYRAVAGTAKPVPNKNSVFWMSERGGVVGEPGGVVTNIQEQTVAVDAARFGATMVREEDGMKQFVTSIFNPHASVMSARSYMDAEVIRKETIL